MSGDTAGFFARLLNKLGAGKAAAAPAEAAAASTHEAATGTDAVPGVSAPGVSGPAPEAAAELKSAARHEAQPDAAEAAEGPELAEGPDVAGEQSKTGGTAEAAPRMMPVKGAVVTVVALDAHAGLATLCAALERRFEDSPVQVRAAGSGLMRAAFAGMLEGTDALLLLAPADPAATAGFQEKLDWLTVNGRESLIERTIFVVNYGAAQDEGALELPADLSRPLVLLPYDAALSIPARQLRAPRRDARHALNQLVEEINTVLG